MGCVLGKDNLSWGSERANKDVWEVEEFYQNIGREFWVIEKQGKIVGTAGYYPIEWGNKEPWY